MMSLIASPGIPLQADRQILQGYFPYFEYSITARLRSSRVRLLITDHCLRPTRCHNPRRV